jgi:hypothetical protein
MTSAADLSPALASALAAASLASQQAQMAADAFDAKAGLSTIPTQHWELLRVAELLSKGLNVAHVQQQQQQQQFGQPMIGVTAAAPPPLFLPTLSGNQAVTTAGSLFKSPLPAAVGAVGALPASMAAALSGVTSAGLQMALASATQVCGCCTLLAERRGNTRR